MCKMEKVKLVLRWIVGIVFIVAGLFSFGSGFVAGFFGTLTGVLIFPKTSDFLMSKITFLQNKKWKIAAVVVSFVIFLFSPDNSAREYSMDITNGQDDPQIVMEFQKDLIDLINNYKEAQIRTVVISQITFGGAELEEAQKYVEETGDQWDEVEKSAKKMEKYIAYQEESEKKKTSRFYFLKLQEAFAKNDDAEKYKVDVDMGSKPGEFTGMENSSAKEVELQDKGKDLVQTKWDMVEVRRVTLPDKSIIRAVTQEFGTTAKKSKELIDQYHGGMAAVWNDEAKYNHSRENFFRVVGTASSVGLTIGGSVVFMGDLVAVAAGPTVLSGLKLAAETAVLAFAKTDAILEVMETGIIVATGDEENAAAITQTREGLSKVNVVVAVKDLAKSPTLADGGNLSTLYNLSGAMVETAKAGAEGAVNTFLFNEEDGKMKVKVGEKFTSMSSDGIVNEYFPSNFAYEHAGWGDDHQKKELEKVKNENNSKKSVTENNSDLPKNDCPYRNYQYCDPEKYNIHLLRMFSGEVVECRMIDGLYQGCQATSPSDVELWEKSGRPINAMF